MRLRCVPAVCAPVFTGLVGEHSLIPLSARISEMGYTPSDTRGLCLEDDVRSDVFTFAGKHFFPFGQGPGP